MSRRFMNLLVSNLGRSHRRPDFYLHRVDPASLFHPTGSPKPAASATMALDALTRARLPPAAVSFDWPCPPNQNGWMEFMSFGDDVVAVDHDGRTLIYDGVSGAVCTMSQANSPKPNAISVTANDGLYILATNPGRAPHTYCFQALMHELPYAATFPFREEWHWRSLLSPPFDLDFVTIENGPIVFEYELGPAEDADPHAIDAYAVVGGSEIWLSTAGGGTYSFDTASRQWRQVGHWALPFRGRVEYVPEHGLWFGFTDGDERLCAADLAMEPPEQQIFPLGQVWEDEPPTPQGWTPTATRLLPVGSGRLCVARFFRRTKGEKLRPSDYRHEKAESMAVLAGVEIFKDAGTGCLEMVNHKSVLYSVGENIVRPL